MFALEMSQDGKDFKPIYVSHRLRKYDTRANAVNGAVHFMKNPVYKAKVIRVYNTEFNNTVAYIRSKEGAEKPAIEYLDSNEIEVKKRDNTVPIELLVEEKSKSTKDRIEFLKECHKKHLEKKRNGVYINKTAGDSINNLSEEKKDKESNTFIDSFTSKVIEISIKMNDYKTLFHTEIMLSQKGYSWYPDENNNIHIKPTKEVLELINKIK